jgi:hypothetical protein
MDDRDDYGVELIDDAKKGVQTNDKAIEDNDVYRTENVTPPSKTTQ